MTNHPVLDETNPWNNARTAGVHALTELGLDRDEALSWADSLSAQNADGLGDYASQKSARHREKFLHRIGIDAQAGRYITSVERLACAVKPFRDAGFTDLATVVELINVHAKPALVDVVLDAGVSLDDVAHVIRAARAAVVVQLVPGAHAERNIRHAQNIVLTQWFGAGIPVEWVQRYLDAAVSLDEARGHFEPMRAEDPEKVEAAVQLLTEMRLSGPGRGIYAA